jgi:metal-responsive CopG/Arc/MetJ family transcriptional regulator
VVRINITIKERSLKAIDRAAAKESRTRSAFFRHIVEEYFALEEARKRRRRAMEKAVTIQDEIRSKTKPWDAIGFIRKMRATNR